MSANKNNQPLYLLLLCLQTAGTVVLYLNGLPLYRQLIDDPSSYIHPERPRAWGLFGIVLIQTGYWIRYMKKPALPRLSSPLLGHLVQFLARLSFTLATAVFSFVFISQRLKGVLPLTSLGLILLGLFSLFCYMQELQNLGNSLMQSKKLNQS